MSHFLDLPNNTKTVAHPITLLKGKNLRGLGPKLLSQFVMKNESPPPYPHLTPIPHPHTPPFIN